MEIRLKILGIFQARRIQMNLMRKLVVLEGDRGSTIAAKHAARTGRRCIDLRRLSGEGKGLVGNTEPCGERGRGVAAAAFAVAMRAPVLRPRELERHGATKTLSPLRHRQASIHAPSRKRQKIRGRISEFGWKQAPLALNLSKGARWVGVSRRLRQAQAERSFSSCGTTCRSLHLTASRFRTYKEHYYGMGSCA